MKVLDETEFYLFKMNAEKPADVTDTEWSQTLGLYVSNPVEKKEIPVSKNEESKPVIFFPSSIVVLEDSGLTIIFCVTK